MPTGAPPVVAWLPDLTEMLAEHYVSVSSHPTADLHILNYTPRCQFQRAWNETTMQCRGLIVDSRGAVAARPFRKFFNLGEHETPLPAEPFDVFEKMDGSLGILYWVEGQPAIATRGSFVSEQARWATRHLRERYGGYPFERPLTYLFEIIYPENRIVVDYAGMADLVLLAVIETATGAELPLPDAAEVPFPVVQRHDGVADIAELLAHTDANREGFVVRFRESNLRVKVKLAEYLRLHRLITGVTPLRIWESLRAGDSLDELLERVPDEFQAWVRDTQRGLRDSYAGIEAAAQAAFVDLGDRRLNAERYKQHAHPFLLFAMLDDKPYADAIWKLLRPAPAPPFRVDEE
ncbi:MAG: ligase [Chloroflexota bacterium]|jgi:RNA ligase|nr:ligase [Chloroflexota bacterium]